MGVDISGWVEVKPDYFDHTTPEDVVMGRWVAIVRNVGFLVSRDYDAFACLFGVRNHANFAPMAADRGIPHDSAEEMRREWEVAKTRFSGTADEPFGESWVAWSELKAADWEEEAQYSDSQLHQYKRDEYGQLIYQMKASWDRRFAESVFADQLDESMRAALLNPGSLAFPPRMEWEIDGVVYRSEKLKRKDAVSAEWRVLFRMMEALATQYGDDGVRLVAWFYW